MVLPYMKQALHLEKLTLICILFCFQVLCEESDDEDDVPTGRGWAVSFLREKGNGVYVFPDVPDEAFVTVTDVVRKVEVAVTRRGVKISSQ